MHQLRPIFANTWIPPVTTPVSALPARKLVVVSEEDPVLHAQLAGCRTWEERCEKATRLAELGARVQTDSQPVDSVRRMTEEVQAFNRSLQADFREFAGRGTRDLEDAVQQIEGVAARSEQLLERVADRMEGDRRAPGKGNSFEERTFQRLLRHAEGRGDAVDWIGAEAEGPDGSKKGDVLYRLRLRDGSREELRVAMEVKAQRATRSGKDPFFLDQLDDAMQNRDCDYGIVVVREDENRQGEDRLFPRFQRIDEHRIVVLVDDEGDIPAPLEVALNLFEAEALAARAPDDPVDLEGVRQAADDVLRSMAMLRTMKKSVTQSISAMSGVREDLDRWDSEVSRGLQRIRELVSGQKPALQAHPDPWHLAR